MLALLHAVLLTAPCANARTTLADTPGQQASEEGTGLRQFELRAAAGDDRAQYSLGRLLMQDGSTAVNLATGYAWFQIAASAYPGKFGGSGSLARSALLKVGPLMSGPDLIRAEQIANNFVTRKQKEVEQLAARAYPILLGLETAPTIERSFGCAADRGLPGCPRYGLGRPTQACTGEINAPDAKPSFGPDNSQLRRPEYPPAARRSGQEGGVVLMAHIDSSGEVCAVVVIQSSGYTLLDEAAVRQARALQFTPAVTDGRAVESVHTFTFGYVLK